LKKNLGKKKNFLKNFTLKNLNHINFENNKKEKVMGFLTGIDFFV